MPSDEVGAESGHAGQQRDVTAQRVAVLVVVQPGDAEVRDVDEGEDADLGRLRTMYSPESRQLEGADRAGIDPGRDPDRQAMLSASMPK